MTNKEFEAQKELILGLVTDLIINYSSKKIVTKLDEIYNLLRINIQPPKPPTCGTCDYVSPVYSLNSDGEGRCIKSMSSYRCKKVTCLRLDSFGDESPTELPLNGFGCNSHSDYGDTE